MTQIIKKIPGILLCFIIALPAWFLGKNFPIIGGPVFAILLGMLIIIIFPNLHRSEISFKKNKKASVDLQFEAGIKYTSKKLLQYSIILLGFNMNLFHVIKVGRQSLFVMLFTLSSSFLTAYFIGKALKLHGKTSILIGVGTSICGGSAIAATAPVIRAESEDVAHAISTIFLFNVMAVFIFPLLGHLWGMSDTGFGMWAGTAINDTSSVVAASASWSAAAGNNTALSFATIVKLTRTLMIVPVTLILSVYTTKKSKAASDSEIYKLSKVFPWFVIGFVAAAIINTFAAFPVFLSDWLITIGKFLIIMAMTAIGLNTNLKKLIKNGFKPIFLGLCCWFAVASVSLLVQVMTKTW